MWILPDQKILKFPKSILIDNIRYPRSIFSRWSKDKLAAIGIRPFKEDNIEAMYYRKSSTYTEEIDGVVYKRWEVAPKYTVEQFKKYIHRRVLGQLKDLYSEVKNEIDFETEFDSGGSLLLFNQYKSQLKTAYQTIKADVLAITDYNELIEYRWDEHFPRSPFEDREI